MRFLNYTEIFKTKTKQSVKIFFKNYCSKKKSTLGSSLVLKYATCQSLKQPFVS